jgi:hypothetical protein
MSRQRYLGWLILLTCRPAHLCMGQRSVTSGWPIAGHYSRGR